MEIGIVAVQWFARITWQLMKQRKSAGIMSVSLTLIEEMVSAYCQAMLPSFSPTVSKVDRLCMHYARGRYSVTHSEWQICEIYVSSMTKRSYENITEQT
jgi:hypothetical protein